MPFFLLALLFVASCQSSKPSLETLESQARQIRTYNVSEPAKFHKAAVKVLLAQGYTIRTSDEERGLIVAVAQRADRANTILEGIPGQSRLLKGELVEFTVSHSLENKKVRARTSLQRLAPYTLGGHEGIEVLDWPVYDGFYGAVNAELLEVGELTHKKSAPATESSPAPSATPKASPSPVPSPTPRAQLRTKASVTRKPIKKNAPRPKVSVSPSPD